MPSSTTLRLHEIETATHLRVVRCEDPSVGYVGFIAVHSQLGGRGVGGTRLRRYPGESEALSDALRLARAMSDKTALAGLPFGGAKAVVMQPAGDFDRHALFAAHGEAVELLGGLFVTAQDVGTTTQDMISINSATRHVAGLPGQGAGDSGPYTGRGVLECMRGAAEVQWGDAKLAGRTIAVQGCGKVGLPLIVALLSEGAIVLAADPDPAALQAAVAAGAIASSPEAVLFHAADIVAPCAYGGVLNASSIPRLATSLIVGGANNQLAEADDAEQLHQAGVVFVPDFLASAGGVISGMMDLAGWDSDAVDRGIRAMRDTTRTVLQEASALGVSPSVVAAELAEQRRRAAGAAG